VSNQLVPKNQGTAVRSVGRTGVAPTVFYVQPLIARYRVEVLEALSRVFKVKLFASSDGVEQRGFSRERPVCEEFIEASISRLFAGRINMQARVVGRIVRDRPAAVLIFADVTYLSLWLALIAGRTLGVPIVIHGQGLYRHPKAGPARTLCYRTAVALSARYICYSEASKRSLERIGCTGSKLVVANNSLRVAQTVDPAEKTGAEEGVLFLGRLRDGSNVESLIEAVEQVRYQGYQIVLHLVGDGEHRDRLQRTYSDRAHLIWHGGVFDDREIAAISRACRIGCYPGAAGLSVVHMFGLSLPPLIHDQLSLHMGPEPEYVESGLTGFLYPQEGGVGALAAMLKHVWELPPEAIRSTAAAAFSKYQRLNSPTLGQRMAEIVDGVIER
jgi:glycosyltransferase involved in cell wall biosynthesis